MSGGASDGERPPADEPPREDGGAAERLLASWRPDLERILRRRAGRAVLDDESAADLAQSVCREALERLAGGRLEYRGEAELRKWLLGAADFKIQNRLRRRASLKRGEEWRPDAHSGPGLDELALDTEPTPSGELARAEEREAFAAALAALQDRERRCVELFHFEQLSHREIAARLEISESHSRTLLARSLARLTEHLRDPET